MPKMKTHTGAKKRFRSKSSGLVKCKQTKMRHLQKNKSHKLKRELRQGDYVDSTDMGRVKFMMPYGA